MIRTVIEGDDMYESFEIQAHYAPEVLLEQMSKAGNAVKVAMRAALTSSKIHTVTRSGIKGNYLAPSSPRPFGQRESLKDGSDSNPSNMKSFVTSFLMESSKTLVVGGRHRAFRPIVREDGEIKGFGTEVGSVSKATYAILNRMNTGQENSHYPTRSKLSKKNIGTGWAKVGVIASHGKVQEYMDKGLLKTFETALNNNPPKKIRRTV